MINRLLLTWLLLTFIGLVVPQVTIAASPTPTPTVKASPTATPKATTAPKSSPSSTPTASVSPAQTTQNLKERIEKIVEEKRDQIEGILDELSGRKRGFIGEIQRVSSETITLKTNKGTQILSVTSDLTLTKAGNKISLDAVAVGDWAIAIGTMADDEFQPERLVISSTSLWPSKQIVTLGSIENLTKAEITITPRSGTEKKTFTLTKNTSYQDFNGDALKVTQLNDDQSVLVVGVTNDKGDEARTIRLLSPVVTPTPRTNAR